MKFRLMLLLLVALVTGASAQNIKSDKGHENNPYYSNTDTKPLHVNNAEWKKILSPKMRATFEFPINFLPTKKASARPLGFS